MTICRARRGFTCDLLEDLVHICENDAVEMAVFSCGKEVFEGELRGFEDGVLDSLELIGDPLVISARKRIS
jgi:hypothetical protein